MKPLIRGVDRLSEKQVAERSKKELKKQAKNAIPSKSVASMTPAEKDALLEWLALELGLDLGNV